MERFFDMFKQSFGPSNPDFFACFPASSCVACVPKAWSQHLETAKGEILFQRFRRRNDVQFENVPCNNYVICFLLDKKLNMSL